MTTNELLEYVQEVNRRELIVKKSLVRKTLYSIYKDDSLPDLIKANSMDFILDLLTAKTPQGLE